MQGLDDTITAAEKIASEAQLLLQSLRRRRNAYTPYIHRLPVELLTLVFDYTLTKVLGYYQELRDLRSVCSGWMTAIDHCPSFWTTVYCTNTGHEAKTAITHSKDLPLNVVVACTTARRLGGTRHNHYRFREELLGVPNRCRSLVIHDETDFELHTWLYGPMHHLQEVSVESESEGQYNRPVTFDWNLRRLVVKKFGLPWSGITAARLRELAIHNLQRYGPSITQITGILQNNQLLEKLIIHDVEISTTEVDDGSALALIPITFPYLTNISLLHVDPKVLLYLLDLIVTPSLHAFRAEPTFCENKATMSQTIEALGDWLPRVTPIWIEPIKLVLTNTTLQLQYGQEHPWPFLARITGSFSQDQIQAWKTLISHIPTPLRTTACSVACYLGGDSTQEEMTTEYTWVDSLFPAVISLGIQWTGENPECLMKPVAGKGWLFSKMTDLRIGHCWKQGAKLGKLAKARRLPTPEAPAFLERLHLLDCRFGVAEVEDLRKVIKVLDYGVKYDG